LAVFFGVPMKFIVVTRRCMWMHDVKSSSDSRYHFRGLSMPRTTASGRLCEGAKMRPFYFCAADSEGVIRMVNVIHIF
jgi:hypothetical protein